VRVLQKVRDRGKNRVSDTTLCITPVRDGDNANTMAMKGSCSPAIVPPRCGNGEVGDRMTLEPEGNQLALLTAVVNATQGTKTKVVCVLIHGRPVSFGTGFPDYSSPLGKLGALLAAWRPGEEGGSAVVNLCVH
jgi:hypothetical protein